MDERVDVACGTENKPIYLADNGLKSKLENFQYVPCNIPGPGTNMDMYEDEIQGCTCITESCDLTHDSTCMCVHQFGTYMTSSGKYQLDVCQNFTKKTFFECNKSCLCRSTCKNRLVQNGIQCDLELFLDDKKGLCLRTRAVIEPGTFVCEYAGEIVSAEEARHRALLQTKNDMNYIFALKEHFAHETVCTYIDPKLCGNIGRFLNHSCEPNLIIVPVRVHTMVPKLCLFANRRIEPMEELTYDYSGGEPTPDDVADQSLVDSSRLKECKCGSRKCHGYLPFNEFAISL